MKKTRTYIIEEVSSYYLRATSKHDAEKKFLEAIRFTPKGPCACNVQDRSVYTDPHDRLSATTRRTRAPR